MILGRLQAVLAGLGLLVFQPINRGLAQDTGTQPNPLKAARTFMYQLQGLEEPSAVEQLSQSSYDLLVVEPTFTIKGSESFDAKGTVQSCQSGRYSQCR